MFSHRPGKTALASGRRFPPEPPSVVIHDLTPVQLGRLTGPELLSVLSATSGTEGDVTWGRALDEVKRRKEGMQ